MPRPSHTIDLRLRDKLRPIARQMRHEPTPAEALLWTHLRNRQLCGYRFHRQHQIDRFIVDFVCWQPKLVIEVDGLVHQHQIEADLEREQILESFGYCIIRFTNDQVLDETAQVLQKIIASLHKICGTRHPLFGFAVCAQDMERALARAQPESGDGG